MAEREQIFQGDSFPVAFECRKPNVNDPTDSRGLPATPTSAFARLMNTQEQVFIEIGGPGVTQVPCTITPATGETPDDKGAIVAFTVAPAFTEDFGTYKLFITANFSDGAVLTEDRAFKVLEFR